MRLRPTLLLISVTLGLAVTATSGTAATSRPVSWRPRAWQPPVSAAHGPALRSDPEDGSASSGFADEFAAQRRALAEVPVQTRRDGSRFARVGGHARRYTVASIAADGSMVQDCVRSEAEARRIVEAASPQKER